MDITPCQLNLVGVDRFVKLIKSNFQIGKIIQKIRVLGIWVVGSNKCF
jgi:hypothetical protein